MCAEITPRTPRMAQISARNRGFLADTSYPARRRHPQGVRRQPHPQGRRHTAGPRQRRTHRTPAQPRPARAVRYDVARPPTPSSPTHSGFRRRPREAPRRNHRVDARQSPAADRRVRRVPRRCPEARPPAVWAGCLNGSCAPQPADLALRALASLEGKPMPGTRARLPAAAG